MQRAHDDFERGFLRKFRMRIDRNTAAIVDDGKKAVRFKFDLDEGGVARQRFVHRVVDDFGEQMMQRLFVGAADIHARSPPNGLEAFQYLDVTGGITGFAGCAGRGPSARRRKGRWLWLWQRISAV